MKFDCKTHAKQCASLLNNEGRRIAKEMCPVHKLITPKELALIAIAIADGTITKGEGKDILRALCKERYE